MYKQIDFLKVVCFFPGWLYHFKTSRFARSFAERSPSEARFARLKTLWEFNQGHQQRFPP